VRALNTERVMEKRKMVFEKLRADDEQGKEDIPLRMG
jgi:hypothetical protein